MLPVGVHRQDERGLNRGDSGFERAAVSAIDFMRPDGQPMVPCGEIGEKLGRSGMPPTARLQASPTAGPPCVCWDPAQFPGFLLLCCFVLAGYF